MEPFIVGIDITSTKDLFGRNREIETLISCAKRKGNAGIIGARRFGKTWKHIWLTIVVLGLTLCILM